MAIRLIVDSSSDITKEEAEKINAIYVPLNIRFGDDVFADGVDLTKDEFYKLLEEREDFPQTAAASPDAYIQAFNQIKNAGDKAILLTISSKVSASYQSALLASQGYEDCIYVLDTLTASLGIRVLIEYAYRRINEGIDFNDLIEEVENKKKYAKIFAFVDNLEYAKKGGRISKFASTLGGLLNIKPILSLNEDGNLFIADKARGLKNGFAKFDKLINKSAGNNLKEIFISYSGLSKENLEKYLELNTERFSNLKLNISQLGSSIGSHAGPGAVVVAFLIEKIN